MKVVRSRVLGFCMGVRRAVAMTTAEAERLKTSGGRVWTLGPLIHNSEALSKLNLLNVREISQPASLPQSMPIREWLGEGSPPDDKGSFSLVIRAHGIDPKIENTLRNRGAEIIDATCPNVKNSQLKAKALLEAGYKLFLAGDVQHAEIAGIMGYAEMNDDKDEGLNPVVSNAAEAEAAAKKLHELHENAKTALIGQTTISEGEYSIIAEAIKKYFPNLEVVQTICTATKDRQQALRELLDKVDAVLIIGGRESANTRRLLAIAQESDKPCALVENASEIPSFFYTLRTVGLSAGASTPDSVIDEIETELLR